MLRAGAWLDRKLGANASSLHPLHAGSHAAPGPVHVAVVLGGVVQVSALVGDCGSRVTVTSVSADILLCASARRCSVLLPIARGTSTQKFPSGRTSPIGFAAPPV